MKTSIKMKWATALMLMPMVLIIPSILNFFIPETFINIYLEHDSGLTIQDLLETQKGIASTIIMGFQGIGFTVIGYHLLGWSLILIPYRKGEKWAWITLLFAQLWLWIVNIVLESMHSGNIFLIIYSVVAILAIVVSLSLSYKTTFRKIA